ncbi:MAG: class I glutamine amidotransferase-like protein [Monoraphidium minutum]|nr:MAG: class I glutamine amidotransferase-like protein [Monoraphidium minutum]
MVQGKKVLIIATSHDKLGDTGESTGLWMEELAHPYYTFKDHGLEVTVASISGGEVPVDEASLAAPFLTPQVEKFLLDDPAMAQVLESVALADVTDWASYDAVFLPGGHGTCWDFPGNELLIKVIAGFARAGKVVSAVCHGPMGLVDVKDAEGAPIVKGREVTAFSDDEEYAVVKEKVVPFLLEARLKELGASYSKSKEKWGVHAMLDARAPFPLVTGQNPASSGLTAELVVEALGGHRAGGDKNASGCEMRVA